MHFSLLLLFFEAVLVKSDPMIPIRTTSENESTMKSTEELFRIEGIYEDLLLYKGGTVCDNGFDDTAAKAICKEMGSPKVFYWGSAAINGYTPYDDQFDYDIKLGEVHCNSDTWADCSFQETHNCTHAEDVKLMCLPQEYRIVDENGNDVKDGAKGLLLYRHTDIMMNLLDAQTVCNEYFDTNNAHQVCRHLGYAGASGWNSRSVLQMNQLDYDITLFPVYCDYGDTMRCPPIRSHDCHHGQDVFLSCSDTMVMHLLDYEDEIPYVEYTQPPTPSPSPHYGWNRANTEPHRPEYPYTDHYGGVVFTVSPLAVLEGPIEMGTDVTFNCFWLADQDAHGNFLVGSWLAENVVTVDSINDHPKYKAMVLKNNPDERVYVFISDEAGYAALTIKNVTKADEHLFYCAVTERAKPASISLSIRCPGHVEDNVEEIIGENVEFSQGVINKANEFSVRITMSYYKKGDSWIDRPFSELQVLSGCGDKLPNVYSRRIGDYPISLDYESEYEITGTLSPTCHSSCIDIVVRYTCKSLGQHCFQIEGSEEEEDENEEEEENEEKKEYGVETNYQRIEGAGLERIEGAGLEEN